MKYGAPKIEAILNKEYHENVVIKRIQRIISDNQIKSITVKKFRPTRNIKLPDKKQENILNRDFSTTWKNAIYNERLNTTLILHSDQGIQYTTDAYEQLCKCMKVLNLSYSDKGCQYDNAPVELFNSIIKKINKPHGLQRL